MDINGETGLIGIIANPIAHVKTPEVINHSVASQGLNVVCLPFHVRENDLANLLKGLPSLVNLQGLVVTIPYKEAMLKHCDELTETASLVGSVNAVRFDQVTGKLIGGNFDGDGMVSGIKNQGHMLRGKRVLLIGAGGAGKSIAYAVAKEEPLELVIYNRSPARGEALVDRLRALLPNGVISSYTNDAESFDVVINSTSLGLKDDDKLPIDPLTLRPGSLVCEAVVREGDTAFLKAARARGCVVHHGQFMLYSQIVQICQFLGTDLKTEHVVRLMGP